MCGKGTYLSVISLRLGSLIRQNDPTAFLLCPVPATLRYHNQPLVDLQNAVLVLRMISAQKNGVKNKCGFEGQLKTHWPRM